MGFWKVLLNISPLEHSATYLCLHHKCSGFFRLEMQLLTTPQLDTSQSSHTSSDKEWSFCFTLSITTDMELLVLIFFIYIISVSLVPWGHPRICKLLNTLSGCGVHRDIQKPTGHSPDECALTDPALMEWGLCFNLKHFMTIRVIPGLSECKHVCTGTPHVTLWFYLATDDKLANMFWAFTLPAAWQETF